VYRQVRQLLSRGLTDEPISVLPLDGREMIKQLASEDAR
jgi:hypothetical protein